MLPSIESGRGGMLSSLHFRKDGTIKEIARLGAQCGGERVSIRRFGEFDECTRSRVLLEHPVAAAGSLEVRAAMARRVVEVGQFARRRASAATS